MLLYIALGALIFFGFFANNVVRAWKHLTPLQLVGATVVLLFLWGPLLIYEGIKHVLSR
jgi:hypothetical protein